MRYIILLILAITIFACCTPGTCPPEDIYIVAVLQDGTETIVKIPKGILNKNESYMTEKEFQEWMREQRGI